MKITDLLQQPHNRRAKGIYKRLDRETREKIVEGWIRHLKACKRAGFDYDPLWLSEAISDAGKGMYAR